MTDEPTKGRTFIQWKGTFLCMDFHCPECGGHSHFDGMFAYLIECFHCKAIWRMPDNVITLVKRVDPADPAIKGWSVLRDECAQEEADEGA